VRELNVPGYSLTVIYKGDTLLQQGYGFANKEARIPVTPETVFGLASITKTFTGLALIMLVEEGKIKLDDQLGQYLDGLSPRYNKLTIRQLASMTAGVPKSVGEELTWEQQIKRLQTLPLDSKPGTTYSYSNLSFRILGAVIQKVSGRPYPVFLQERILGPLGMSQTGPTDRSFAPPIATPYDVKKNGRVQPLEGYKSPAVNFAAGMLASNSIDMAKYAQALLDRKLLSPRGYNLLWKERRSLSSGEPTRWAFGWGSSNKGGHWKLGMNGGLPGVASSIQIYPDDQLIVIGLANASGNAHSIGPIIAKEILGVDVEDRAGEADQ
jgi:CubicO group peptidase (beta-lactamase class C family)